MGREVSKPHSEPPVRYPAGTPDAEIVLDALTRGYHAAGHHPNCTTRADEGCDCYARGTVEARTALRNLEEQLEATRIENRFWRSQVGADPDEPLAIPIDAPAPPEAIELGRKLAERYGWASNPASEPNDEEDRLIDELDAREDRDYEPPEVDDWRPGDHRPDYNQDTERS